MGIWQPDQSFPGCLLAPSVSMDARQDPNLSFFFDLIRPAGVMTCFVKILAAFVEKTLHTFV
jgi:hypothetical protein